MSPAGAQNSPVVNDPTVGSANLLITFNTGSNNITYQLTAFNISEVKAAHIHVNAGPGANGSVAIPLYQSRFVSLPNATTTGLLAASALTPAVFVGPLEVLPDYNNVDVPTVLGQYIIPGLAYAQVSTCTCLNNVFATQYGRSPVACGCVVVHHGLCMVYDWVAHRGSCAVITCALKGPAVASSM